MENVGNEIAESEQKGFNDLVITTLRFRQKRAALMQFRQAIFANDAVNVVKDVSMDKIAFKRDVPAPVRAIIPVWIGACAHARFLSNCCDLR